MMEWKQFQGEMARAASTKERRKVEVEKQLQARQKGNQVNQI
jgi:hypothetical protein